MLLVVGGQLVADAASNPPIGNTHSSFSSEADRCSETRSSRHWRRLRPTSVSGTTSIAALSRAPCTSDIDKGIGANAGEFRGAASAAHCQCASSSAATLGSRGSRRGCRTAQSTAPERIGYLAARGGYVQRYPQSGRDERIHPRACVIGVGSRRRQGGCIGVPAYFRPSGCQF